MIVYFDNNISNINNKKPFLPPSYDFTNPPPPIYPTAMPRNKEEGGTPDGMTITEVPLSLPSRDTPMPAGHQTLLSLIDSQRPRDTHGNPILPRRRRQPQPQGAPTSAEPEESESEEEEEELEDLIGPLGTSFFWAVPLTFLLAAFDVIVYQQYAQELAYAQIGLRCLKALPLLLALLRLIHPHRARTLAQAGFFLTAVAGGCWIVHAANRHAYYNVMKRAPPVGVLWIWAAAEMDLAWLVGSCLVVVGWVWWGGYEIV